MQIRPIDDNMVRLVVTRGFTPGADHDQPVQIHAVLRFDFEADETIVMSAPFRQHDAITLRYESGHEGGVRRAHSRSRTGKLPIRRTRPYGDPSRPAFFVGQRKRSLEGSSGLQ